jgi:hypothetical protein
MSEEEDEENGREEGMRERETVNLLAGEKEGKGAPGEREYTRVRTRALNRVC